MLTIRKIEPKDYKKTAEMIRTTVKFSYRNTYSKNLIEAFAEKYNSENLKKKLEGIEMFVASFEDGNIIGTIGIKNNELRSFYVHPDYQGKKNGSKLYRYFEKTAKDRGLKKIILEGNPVSKSIYEHFGFVEIKPIKKERAGEEYILFLMEKNI